MENLQDVLGVQNISDLVLREIYGIYKTKLKWTKHKRQQRRLCQKWFYDYCY